MLAVAGILGKAASTTRPGDAPVAAYVGPRQGQFLVTHHVGDEAAVRPLPVIQDNSVFVRSDDKEFRRQHFQGKLRLLALADGVDCFDAEATDGGAGRRSCQFTRFAVE